MKMVAISQELSSTSYPGRGIIIGKSVLPMEAKRLQLILLWEEASTAEIVFL